jgi:hypothetical protein
MRRELGAVLMGAALLLSAATQATAQLVTGRVVGAGTDAGLRDVAISLRTDDGHLLAGATSDTAGEFRMRAPRFGTFEVFAELIGYRGVRAPVDIRLGEQVEVRIVMDVAAVALEPITVRSRAPWDMGRLGEFYERMERNRLAGIGHFMTRDRIDTRGAFEISELLQDLPRVAAVRDARGSHVTFREPRGGCTPAVFINGVLANRNERAYIDELLRPHDLEGVEVYQGLARLPGRYHDETGCGVIGLWTRAELAGEGRPFSWRRVALATGIAIVIVFLFAR